MKKILLIIAIILCIFQMVVLATAIDIGSAAIDRPYDNSEASVTLIDKTNPANGTGTITSIEVWVNGGTASNLEVATFYVVSGNNLSTRDTEYIGTVPAGSKQTFSVNLDVQEGDFIGLYLGTGAFMELDIEGGLGVYTKTGDYIPCTNTTFALIDSSEEYAISLYGTGATGNGAAKDNAIFMGMNF